MNFNYDFINLIMALLTTSTQIADDVSDGLRFSTIYAPDIQKYETAIEDLNNIYPVERYETKELAVAGHEKWLNNASSLSKITKLGYGTTVPDIQVELVRSNPEYFKRKV